MSNYAVLVASAKVRPDSDDAFAAWQLRYSTSISQSAGFISSDTTPPRKPGDPWIITVNFESGQHIAGRQKTAEHLEIVGSVAPLLTTGKLEERIITDAEQSVPGAEVTEVIFSKVRAGMADKYRDWAGRIQAAQAKYPGYRGMYLQPPAGGKDGHWTSILRYESAAHLEAWMNAPERQSLLEETKDFIESEDLMRIGTAFPGWVPLDPATGEAPPNWKAAMLVLLGLFPIVMLEMKFLSPVLTGWGIHASLDTFIGNCISVALTSFATMPFFVRWFGWWLFPKNDAAATTKGIGLLAILFATEIIVLWKLLPW